MEHHLQPVIVGRAAANASSQHPMKTLLDRMRGTGCGGIRRGVMHAEESGEARSGQQERPFVQDNANRRTRWPLTREQAQLAVAFAMIVLVGMNDSATGANLDSMQEYYQVSYNKISAVFLSNVAGYFLSCCSSSFLSQRLGLSKSLLVAAASMSVGCLILAFAPPFGVFVFSLAFLGFGSGLYDTCLTTVVSHQEDGVMMSWLYACFGVGATFSPLVIGSFVDAGLLWARYYWVPFSVSVALAIVGHFVFSTYSEPADEVVPDLPLTELSRPNVDPSASIVERRAVMSVQTRMRRVLGLRVAWVGFMLVILAFASGNTLSAWIVSFLIEKRQSPAAASRYILSGLWAGIATGRVVLAFALRARMSEQKFAALLLLVASIFLGLIMAVRNFVVDAVAIALVGFFMGPVTPQIFSAVSSRVPPSLKSSIISLTVGLGLIGSSLGPLLFGLAAGKGALGALPVVLIVTCVLAAGSWLMVPKNERRED